MTEDDWSNLLDDDAIIRADHHEYDELIQQFSKYVSERTLEYSLIFEQAANHPDSKFLIGDKAMAIVRAKGLVTSLGAPIRLGDQLAGVVVQSSLQDEISSGTFHLIFNESELADIGEVVDTVWVDFIEPIGQMNWGVGYTFYDGTFSFISYNQKYYELLENSSNTNRSYNILHYL